MSIVSPGAAAKASQPWSSMTEMGPLVASFPIEDGDQIMLVTDAGKLIRCPIQDVRIASRNTQGVRVFRTDKNERVVSVERISEDLNGDDEEPGNGDAGNGNPQPDPTMGDAPGEAPTDIAVDQPLESGDDANGDEGRAPTN